MLQCKVFLGPRSQPALASFHGHGHILLKLTMVSLIPQLPCRWLAMWVGQPHGIGILLHWGMMIVSSGLSLCWGAHPREHISQKGWILLELSPLAVHHPAPPCIRSSRLDDAV